MRVHVLVFHGVDDLDVAGPFETLAMARRAGADVSVRLDSVNELPVVTTAGGLRLGPISPWSPAEADVVLVPGGGPASSQRPGVAAELNRGQIPVALRDAVRPGLVVASVCTGA